MNGLEALASQESRDRHNLAEAMEHRNNATRTEVNRKLESEKSRWQFFEEALDKIVLELHEHEKLDEDYGVFSASELQMIVADENADLCARMLVYTIREAIRDYPDQDWKTFLVKNKGKLAKKFSEFKVQFNWAADHKEWGLKGKMMAAFLRASFQGELGVTAEKLGLTRVVVYETENKERAVVTLLHELQHVANTWLGIQSSLRPYMVWGALRKYLSKENMPTRLGYILTRGGLLLYTWLAGKKVEGLADFATSAAVAVCLELLVLAVRDKVEETWWVKYRTDQAEVDARDFAEDSLLLKENISLPTTTTISSG